MLSYDTGVLSAVTGFGKTVLAAYCISKRKANTLVLVHRQELLGQWKEKLSSFLELAPNSIGQIGAGKRAPTGIIDIAINAVCLESHIFALAFHPDNPR